MPTLYEYFVRDARSLTNHQTFSVSDKATGEKLGEFIARLHFDFDANATYISFYIPDMTDVELPEAYALNQIPTILKWPVESVIMQVKFGEEQRDAKDL